MRTCIYATIYTCKCGSKHNIPMDRDHGPTTRTHTFTHVFHTCTYSRVCPECVCCPAPQHVLNLTLQLSATTRLINSPRLCCGVFDKQFMDASVFGIGCHAPGNHQPKQREEAAICSNIFVQGIGDEGPSAIAGDRAVQ